MTVSLTHAFVSSVPDDPGAVAGGQVVPSEWDAQHVLTLATGNALGRTSAGTGPVQELPLGDVTAVNDTNVTVSLGGTPVKSVFGGVSFTFGWSGTLAAGRLNANVVQSVNNDTNVTGTVSAQALTLGWAGTLVAARLNANVVQGITNDTNVTGTISAQNLTLGWTGTLANSRLANMAAHSYKGNNTASTAGPADVTSAQLRADLGIGGCVRMAYVNGAWVVYAPDGTMVSTSGTTTTGLQEAINYAQTNGYSLEVVGPGTIAGSPGGAVAVINCSTAITINPIQNWNFRCWGCIINFPSSASGLTGTCITIGTINFCSIDFDCTIQSAAPCGYIVQVVDNGTSYPSTVHGIQFNSIHIRTIICAGNTPTGCIQLSGVTHSMNNNYIRCEIIDSGGFAQFGILVVNPVGGTSGFVQNIIDVGLVTSSTADEVQIGTSAVTTPLAANVWRFGGITPSETGVNSALNTYAFDDTYYIGSISLNAGTCTYGVYFGSSTKNNFLVAGQCDIGSPPVSDNGTNNTYFVGGAGDGKYHVKAGVPTSSSGLATGEWYTNSKVLTIV